MPDAAPAAPGIAEIDAAALRLQGRATRTPLLNAPLLDRIAGRRVFVKAECLQRTGSFKFRGAWSAVSALPAAADYAAAVDRTVWRCEWRIPLGVLQFTPGDRAALPLNVTAYRSEDDQFIQWAGTLGETWDLTRGGRLFFRTAATN